MSNFVAMGASALEGIYRVDSSYGDEYYDGVGCDCCDGCDG
jgi:hypothetical protein